MKIQMYLNAIGDAGDNKSEWRWRAIAANGRIIADSGEGYSTKAHVERAIEHAIELFRDPITFEEAGVDGVFVRIWTSRT